MNLIKLLLAATFILLSGQALASFGKILNLSARPKMVTSGSCTVTSRGGLLAPNSGNPACVVDIPVPLSSDRGIEQVTIYYGVNGSGYIGLKAELRYKDAASANGWYSTDHATPFSWTSTGSGYNPGSVLSQTLMSPGSIGNPFPDEFLIGSQRAYYVRVTLTKGGVLGSKPELFGVSVDYN